MGWRWSRRFGSLPAAPTDRGSDGTCRIAIGDSAGLSETRSEVTGDGASSYHHSCVDLIAFGLGIWLWETLVLVCGCCETD